MEGGLDKLLLTELKRITYFDVPNGKVLLA